MTPLLPRIAPTVSSQPIEDELLLFDGHQLHLLAPSAARIWVHIDGVSTAEEIAAAVAREQGQSPALIALRMEELLEQAIRTGLVEMVRPAGGGHCIRSAATAFVQDDDGTIILMDLRTGRRQALSHTGGAAWGYLEEYGTLSEVAEHLAADFDVDVEAVTDDLEHFAMSLIASGYLRISADDST